MPYNRSDSNFATRKKEIIKEKTMDKRLLTITAAALLSGASMTAAAQEKSEESIRNHSLYKSLLDVEAYNYAAAPFQELFTKDPKYSKQMYIDGVKIYKGLYAQAADAKAANAYADTIKAIYMQRIQYFGDSANVLGRCGIDIMKLRKSDNGYMEAFDLLDQSVTLYKGDPEISVASSYLQLATSLAAAKKITVSKYCQSTMPVLNALYTNIASGKKDATYAKNAESVFNAVKNGSAKLNQKLLVSTVDSLTTQSDIDNNAAILCKVLQCLNCDNSDSYAKASEIMYQNNPTAEAASAIARFYKRSQKWDKAAQYYQEAAQKTTDDLQKSDYLYETASAFGMLHKYYEAVSFAKKSAELNASNGKPLLLIAAIYGANAPSLASDAFERGKIYWVAADYAAKAKRADYNLKNEAESLINKYAHQFPSKEEAFMHSVQGGQQIEVEILKFKESTSARF